MAEPTGLGGRGAWPGRREGVAGAEGRGLTEAAGQRRRWAAERRPRHVAAVAAVPAAEQHRG